MILMISKRIYYDAKIDFDKQRIMFDFQNIHRDGKISTFGSIISSRVHRVYIIPDKIIIRKIEV